MKRLLLALSLATIALSGCAQLKEATTTRTPQPAPPRAEEQRPFPSPSRTTTDYASRESVLSPLLVLAWPSRGCQIERADR